MPRIDPIQLLNCLSVLLSPSGGIKSRDEVQRLASLMTKFSKKLVSKCIYIQILKCTETDLLGLFMGSGGWLLVHMWLTESIVAKNWPLVKELLELLLLCPVDIERLKTNNCPKLVKELSKDGNQYAIRALASKLVEQWLKTVKGEQVIPVQLAELTKIVTEANNEFNIDNAIKSDNAEVKTSENEEYKVPNLPDKQTDGNDNITEKDVADTKSEDSDKVPILKISLKDSKQVLSQIDDSVTKPSEGSDADVKNLQKNKKDKSKDRSSSSSSKSNSSSSRHSSKRHSSSSGDKSKSNHKSSSSRHSSREESKDMDKHSSSSSKSKTDSRSSKSSGDRSSSSTSSRSKEERRSSSDKEKSKEKSKDEKLRENVENSTDEKASTPSIHKLGKIPKLSGLNKEKPSISIEVRKPDEPKPKTVKTFHSKFRKHGLEEEAKPPPSRAAVLNKKPPPVVPPPSMPIPKRPSPVHNESPPEKKIKIIEPVEKPGAIKLIPPKPKPMLLLESDMFMSALNASATNKKEPKKRKRRTSGSKDGNAPNDGSPPHTPNSPTSESKSIPPRFYQDTLETDENKEKLEKNSDATENKEAESDKVEETVEPPVPHTLTVNGLKGVLCYHKKKGPKKSIKWKPEAELEEIQYFELDETERVNVTKNFTDMKHLDRIKEREAFQMSRNLSSDDVMEEKTTWKPLVLVDVEGQIKVDYGKNSKEKDLQAIRQKGTLQPLYFNKAMIPDSALEPEPETHPYTEPTIIPLEDIVGNQDNVSDFRTMPWPEPKGNAPPVTTLTVPPMFTNNMMQVPNGFPTPQFPGVQVVPGPFIGPNMVPGGEWQNGLPPHMMNSMPPGVIAPGGLPPGAMPPGLMMPTDNMMMAPDMYGAPNQMFPMPPDAFNMPQNMFPMDFNMAGPPQGPPGPDNFNGPGNYRGAMRGRGSGHWRGKAAGNWDNNQRGRGGVRGGGGRKTVCIYFQRKGSCRQGDNCSFLHPGVNGPY